MSPANILILKQIKMKSIFTTPKVVKFDDLSKPWYVYFRYNGKLFRFKKGINYIDDYKQREIEANSLCDALYDQLKEKWNPNVQDDFAYNSNMTIIEAINFAFEKKKPNISTNTITAYNTVVQCFIRSVRRLKLNDLYITDTKKIHIKSILENIRIKENWTNKSYNKNSGYLKAIFTELVDWL